MQKTQIRINSGFYQKVASLWLGLWLITPGWAFALPEGGDIVSGTGTISQTGPDMVIQQNSSHLITNWQQFNIGTTESVTFQQPNSSAVALNRVIGTDPSLILGKLSANGQVFLSNPSGVVFGNGSVVDVHGLLATTLNISDADFLNGKYQFSQDPTLSLASVINNGTISAKSYASLLAPAVQNSGSIIVADLGSVALGSGQAATLDFNGDGLISFALTKEVSGAVTDSNGNIISDRINNSGLIRANGGQVMLSAQSAKDVIGNVINHTGIVEAQTVVNDNGKIILAGVRSDVGEADVAVSSNDSYRTEYYVERPVVVKRYGAILINGGGHGDVQLSGTLDASQILVSAGSKKNGSGMVTVASGNSLTTNNGTIAIVADDLVLEGDLNSGQGDVFFVPANGGNLTLSPDGSKGADLGGNDLSHITARNLVLGAPGNIIVKGMDEASTQGISDSVFLVSGNNVIFNVGASVFSALKVFASNNINVNQNVTTTRSDFLAVADFGNNGNGDFNVAPGVVITSARDIDVSAPSINADTETAFKETRDLILNGDVVVPEPPVVPDPPMISGETEEAIEQGSLGTFLTEFFQNGGSSGTGGC